LLPFGGLTKKYIAALALLLLGAGTAHAANCDALPNTLTNGQTADASQVMANFNTLMSCADNNLLAIANSLSEIASGGSSAQRTARTNLGFTGPGIVIGSAGGSYTSPTTANTNILLYDNSATNWAGIGSDVSGRTYFVTGVTAPAARLVIGLNGGIFTPGATGGDVGAQGSTPRRGITPTGCGPMSRTSPRHRQAHPAPRAISPPMRTMSTSARGPIIGCAPPCRGSEATGHAR
jgi:hypothetical protein